ncbi:MAG: PAS domain-containing protein, partial [Burkholderiales bacterium]|nr:PAS domain-containing protein [Burkholderiales bacterium]
MWSALLAGGGLVLLLRHWHLAPSTKQDQAPNANALRLLNTLALQNAIVHSVNVSSIATDAQGIIQIFNAGAEHMLGYSAQDVIGKMTPGGLSDAQEAIERAVRLSREMQTPIAPGFEALVYKA